MNFFDFSRFGALIPTLPLWANILIVFLPALPNLWAIWHSTTHDFASAQEKMLWTCLSVFVPVFGGVLYFFFGLRRSTPRKKNIQQ